MEHLQFVTGKVQLCKLRNWTEAKEQLVGAHEYAVTWKIVWRKVEFSQVSKEWKTRWQSAEIVGGNLKALQIPQLSKLQQVAWRNLIVT